MTSRVSLPLKDRVPRPHICIHLVSDRVEVQTSTQSMLGMSTPSTKSAQLVVLEDLQGPVIYQDGDAYRAALEKLEQNWFAPLRSALLAGKISRLRIESSTAYGALAWESSRADQWKLWRRARPLATVAQDLAKGSA